MHRLHEISDVPILFSDFASKTQTCELGKMSSDVVCVSSAPAFAYDRFEDASTEIRLLEINHHTCGSLKLKLSVYKKVHAPEYNAISYTWSDGGVPRWVEITVNDQVMVVTENCRYALEQASSHIHPNQLCQTLFWIDSICIDQSSDLEKQHQVAMMADIYAQAVKVLSCVGCHRDYSEDLAQVLKAARAFAGKRLKSGGFPHNAENDWFDREDHSTRAAVKSFVLYQFAALESLTIYPFFGRFMQSFFDFSERCYWTRLWIVQEVAASKQLEVLCGSDKFSRSDIYLLHWIATCFWYSVDSTSIDRGAKGVFYSNVTFSRREEYSGYPFLKFVLSRNSKDRIPAEEIFSLRSEFGCSRPEDRVYGMLKLVKWPDVNPRIEIKPVYRPSATVDLAELFLFLGSVKKMCYKFNRFCADLFKGLEICHDLAEVERLIRERSVHSSASPRRPGKYPEQTYHCDIGSCEVLSKSNTGMLTTELGRINTAANKIHSTPDLNNTGSQLLYAGSSIAGVLCSSACEHDLIIRTPFGKVLLVLRSTEISHQYEIVGQGFLLAGFELPKERPWHADTRKAHAKARIDSYIRDTLHEVDPRTKDLETYDQDPELCRRYLQDLYQKMLKQYFEAKYREKLTSTIGEKALDLNMLSAEFLEQTNSSIRRTLNEERLGITDLVVYEQDPELCRRYLESLYPGKSKQLVIGEEPYLNMVEKKMTSRLVASGEEYYWPSPEKIRLDALRHISNCLEDIDEIQEFEKQKLCPQAQKIGWSQNFVLSLEPLELLLLACQDLEKDGSRNKDKMIQRLTTKVYGKVIAE